jgi:hypothetical protein
MDCLQTTLAVVADHAHGTGTHLRLGGRWSMPGDSGVAPTLERRLAQARELLGLNSNAPHQLTRVTELNVASYVIADAFHLPWLPYAGHRHLDHSFLVEPRGDQFMVVDAYHNDTPWGSARPGVLELSAGELESAVAHRCLTVPMTPTATLPALDPASLLAENAHRARTAAPAVQRYLDRLSGQLADPTAMAALVLDIWVLGRERRLHAAWLGPAHRAAKRAADRADAWQRLAGQSYVAQRRLDRGVTVHSALIDGLAGQLAADADFADFACASATDPSVAAAIRAALRDTLGLDVRDDMEPFRSLPGFDSFRLVEVIDRVERTLGLLLPPDISGDELQDLVGLCRAFARADSVPAVG